MDGRGPEHWAKRAAQLATRGYPAPNPHVGCVIIRDGVVVGEGYHAHAGGPHAEIVALEQAGAKAKGADVFVTLEPCAHHGKTPPCTDALIRAKVGKVWIAVEDPNPKAAGGAHVLCEAGIHTQIGVGRAEAEAAMEQFLVAHREKRAYTVLKVAIGLDGRIALPGGASQWITGPKARKVGHRLRAELGAVLVGAKTILYDNPRLTARGVPGSVNPVTRVVLDPELRTTGREIVFRTKGSTIVFGQDLPRDANGDFSPLMVQQALFEQGITGVLVEGGAYTISRFLEAGAFDRLEVFVSPRVLGQGPNWVTASLLDPLGEVPPFRFERVKAVGEDLWLTVRPVKPVLLS